LIRVGSGPVTSGRVLYANELNMENRKSPFPSHLNWCKNNAGDFGRCNSASCCDRKRLRWRWEPVHWFGSCSWFVQPPHHIRKRFFFFFSLSFFVFYNIDIKLDWIFGSSVSQGLEEESIGCFNGFRFRFTKS